MAADIDDLKVRMAAIETDRLSTPAAGADDLPEPGFGCWDEDGVPQRGVAYTEAQVREIVAKLQARNAEQAARIAELERVGQNGVIEKGQLRKRADTLLDGLAGLERKIRDLALNYPRGRMDPCGLAIARLCTRVDEMADEAKTLRESSVPAIGESHGND